MFHTKFQASGPSGSEEEDFFNIFLYISLLETQNPLWRANLDPGPCI